MSWQRTIGMLAAVAAVWAAGTGRAADKSIDDEGFIRLWLVAGPFALPAGVEPGDAVEQEQVKGEAKLDPKAGDKAKAGDKEATWKQVIADDYYVDLNGTLGESERSVAYLVARVVSPDARKVALKIGSDDQCKVYLNGEAVLKTADERPVDKDQNTVTLDLKKGTNVLVMKVINGGGEWKACARFVEPEKPLTGLKIEFAK